MADYPETIGVVLAGGRSSRMGGEDKAFVSLAGEPMIGHVARRLAAQCSAVVINSNGDPDRFAAYGLPVIADSYPDFRGPLTGVLAALDWMAEHHPSAQWLTSIAVDTPLFPKDFVRYLHHSRLEREAKGSPPAQIVVAATSIQYHPVDALWSITIRETLREAIATNSVGRIGIWIQEHDPAIAYWDTLPYDPFLNINTPTELDLAEIYKRMEYSESTRFLKSL